MYPLVNVPFCVCGLVTTTFTAPAPCAAVVAVIWVALTTTTFVAAVPPNVTVAPVTKFVPVKSEEQRPASDAHSFMELFGKLERDWGLAAEKKDQKSLDEIMADEFIERDATDPDNVITRTKWMQERLSDYKLDPLQIRSMTIRAFLGNVVVSFVQKQKATQNGAGRSAEYFIVDVWVARACGRKAPRRIRSRRCIPLLAAAPGAVLLHRRHAQLHSLARLFYLLAAVITCAAAMLIRSRETKLNPAS